MHAVVDLTPKFFDCALVQISGIQNLHQPIPQIISYWSSGGLAALGVGANSRPVRRLYEAGLQRERGMTEKIKHIDAFLVGTVDQALLKKKRDEGMSST